MAFEFQDYWNMQKCALMLLAKNAAIWDEFSLFWFFDRFASYESMIMEARSFQNRF